MKITFNIRQDKRKALIEFHAAAVIIEIACRHFQITPGGLESPERHWRMAWPRFLAMYMIRRHTCMSSDRLGKLFCRDHAAVLHACKRVEQELATTAGARLQVAKLEKEILTALNKEAAA